MEDKTIHINKMGFSSSFSFRPLIRAWEKVINEEGPEGSAELYTYLLNKIKQHPELLEPIRDLSILDKHKSLVEQIMTTLFPITLSGKENLYSVSVPFDFHTIYSSELFKKTFLSGEGTMIHLKDPETEKRIHDEKKAGAYQLIMKKFYGLDICGNISSVHLYKSPITGHNRYMELELDAGYIDVFNKKPLPECPTACVSHYTSISDVVEDPRFTDWLPLEDFSFEGMVIINIRDVTERETINNIKNSLLTLESFSDKDTFSHLQEEVRNLIGIPAVTIGITPFFNVNQHLVFSAIHSTSSLFIREISNDEEKNALSLALQHQFAKSSEPLIVEEFAKTSLTKWPFLKHLQQQDWKGIIVYPLRNHNKLIGTLEVVSQNAGELNKFVASKIEPAIPLFELALKKSSDNLDARLDKIIKEQFTAIQSSVEWRFTEAALNYLGNSSQDEDAKIEPILFQNVFPLYGAVDIRNSSTERNSAIQKDMLEQLEMAGSIIKKAQQQADFPLLEEISFKIRKFIHSVSNIVLSDDEISINVFMKDEIVRLFQHLRMIVPTLEGEIDAYFTAVNSAVDMIYHHRKDFDESITYINKAVAKFIDKEQQAAQLIFPHYFERFITDGVDFNIYIGQSISPRKIFDDFYLKNLKIWQLSTLAKAAQLSKQLENDIAIPLQTTQLILAHSHPISISFRPAERKFDVDGAYNIRYEIIKKRIDKVHIKDSNERLTQPGKIGIVYTQPKEAAEYLEYIEYLQNQGLLIGEVERFELEELQGVSGLRALRVAVNVSQDDKKENNSQRKAAMN